MLPHEKVPPFQRSDLDAGRNCVHTASWANALNSPHGIFQPQASRAGNAFFNIQEALKSDRVSANMDATLTQQQRTFWTNAHKCTVDHSHDKRMNNSYLGPSCLGVPVTEVIGEVLHGSADDSSAGEEDDFDYFKYCTPSHHDSSRGSRIAVASDLQASSEATCTVVRNWIKYFTPHELVSVNAACSIFSPGSNWPGNVNLKQADMDCQNKKHPRSIQQNTLTSLVLRADAEKSFSLRHSQDDVPLNPVAVSDPPIQSQSKASLTARPPQPMFQHSKAMPPPSTTSDQKSKILSSATASKRSRGFRNDKPPESVGDPCPVEPDLSADRPVVHVHVPSFCECGSTVVGVWYNKKPYYCQWFRHKRYAALRRLLEQNRCKSKNVSDRWKANNITPTSSTPFLSSREGTCASSGDVATSAQSCADADALSPEAPPFGALGSPGHHRSLLPNSLGIGKSLEMPPRHVDGVDASQDEIQIVNTPDGSTSDSVSSRDHDDTATPSVKKQKIVEDARVSELTEDEVSNVLEESEYSAPKFMSLVCIMQMVKLMDAVGILFPHTLPQGVQPITSKKEFLDQFSNAKMSAHIDCPNCKAFVSYRWYANDVKKLKTHLASTDQDSQKVVGCCSLGHWKRKPPGAKPGRGDAKSCPQFLVNSRVIMQEVYSPFELTDQQPQHVHTKSGIPKTLNDRRNGLADEPLLVDWETLDRGVWNVVRSLKLLSPEALDASLATPFCQNRPVQPAHSISCSQLCDPHLNILRPEQSDSSLKGDGSALCPSLDSDSSAH